MLRKFIRIIETASGRSLELDQVDLARAQPEEQELRLLRQMIGAGLLPRSTKPEIVRNLLRVFSAHVNTQYRPPRSFGGSIHLLQAEDPSPLLIEEGDEEDHNARAAEEWTRYARELRVTKVPGNHMTLLSRPNVDSVTQYIRMIWIEHGARASA